MQDGQRHMTEICNRLPRQDMNTVYSMIVDYVKVESLNTVSVTENSETLVNIYPNPAHDYIYFDSPGTISVNIYNISGSVVLSKRDLTNGLLSISDLAPGIYSLQYRQNCVWRWSKLIKY